jgi:hypothetical protein
MDFCELGGWLVYTNYKIAFSGRVVLFVWTKGLWKPFLHTTTTI